MVHVEGKDDRMVANNLEPHYLTHPGEVIKDELEFRGISQRRLAAEIGVPASQLNEVLNAKRPLSAEMALLIGQALAWATNEIQLAVGQAQQIILGAIKGNTKNRCSVLNISSLQGTVFISRRDYFQQDIWEVQKKFLSLQKEELF